MSMPINEDLTDSEGFVWLVDDLETGVVNIRDVGNDAFDGAMQLVVNGTAVNPQTASVDGGELTMAPVMIGGIAVQRQILVSDATISATGFARFLDSFTNTTGAEVTITVTTQTNSGADGNLQFPLTSSGDTNLNANDTGFTTSDGAGPDTAAMIAFGEAGSLNSLPSDVTRSGDAITVTHTITLAPGETRSLLQFATANNSDAEASSDLNAFTQNAVGLNSIGALSGLSREEMLSIVNYTGFDQIVDPFELRDSDGNLWTIDAVGRISSATGAINDFGIPVFFQNWTTLVSSNVDEATDTVTLVTGGFAGNPNSTVTYDYTALEDLGVIRLLVTFDNTNGVSTGGPLSQLASGPNGSDIVGHTNGGPFDRVTGVIIDDSLSGSGGLVPNATVVWGSISPDDTASLNVDTLLNEQGNVTLFAGQQATFLYFLAVNDTGLAALADLQNLSTPDPRLLAYLSAAEVANLQNFQIIEFQGRLQEILGSIGDVDDVLTGNEWGDSIVGGAGDDDLAGLGSDDVLRGGEGGDVIDGGDGDDSLFGGTEADTITGGTGNDDVFAEDGDDVLHGQTGDDTLFGGNGNDRLIGGAGSDGLIGGADRDTLHGNQGSDALFGDEGFDDLFGGGGDDEMFGGDDGDFIFGGKGNDTLDGGGGDDLLDGGEGVDVLFGGLDSDTLRGGTGNDTLNGDDGNDLLEGGDNTDSLYGGNNDDQLFGGNGADRLYGGAGNDSLTGGTAAESGTNRLYGGQGGDSYFITSTRDLVTEVSGGTGTDAVFSDISYTLTIQVENLILTGTAANGTGNGSANVIVGNAAANVLDGGLGADTLTSGLGNDTLIGGSASDVFVFDTALGASNVDHISDFGFGNDRIHLDDAIFTAFAPGTVPGGTFIIGTVALQFNDYLLYDTATGILRYDADGNGAGASEIVAVFDNLAAVNRTDFLIV
jgi:Ca2+-binding RTX toxin-like protein